MIITPDDEPSKQLSDNKVRDELQASPEEPPPPYSPPDGYGSIASGSAPLPGVPSFKTKPTNFLILSTKNNTIRGEYVIDPSIRIPSSILPSPGGGETADGHKNLSLASEHGSVHADIWLLGNAIGTQKPRRTTIALASVHGSIHGSIHTLDGATPFLLTARTAHGTVRLELPRSFQGLLLVSSRHGSISLSDALVENATLLGQLEITRRYFVGDFQALSEDEWEGDQVEIEAPHGSIRVKYNDEVATSQGAMGLLGRLFGI